jgi:hypothetical protein
MGPTYHTQFFLSPFKDQELRRAAAMAPNPVKDEGDQAGHVVLVGSDLMPGGGGSLMRGGLMRGGLMRGGLMPGDGGGLARGELEADWTAGKERWAGGARKGRRRGERAASGRDRR